jgi:hypothetical protein
MNNENETSTRGNEARVIENLLQQLNNLLPAMAARIAEQEAELTRLQKELDHERRELAETSRKLTDTERQRDDSERRWKDEKRERAEDARKATAALLATLGKARLLFHLDRMVDGTVQVDDKTMTPTELRDTLLRWLFKATNLRAESVLPTGPRVVQRGSAEAAAIDWIPELPFTDEIDQVEANVISSGWRFGDIIVEKARALKLKIIQPHAEKLPITLEAVDAATPDAVVSQDVIQNDDGLISQPTTISDQSADADVSQQPSEILNVTSDDEHLSADEINIPSVPEKVEELSSASTKISESSPTEKLSHIAHSDQNSHIVSNTSYTKSAHSVQPWFIGDANVFELICTRIEDEKQNYAKNTLEALKTFIGSLLKIDSNSQLKRQKRWSTSECKLAALNLRANDGNFANRVLAKSPEDVRSYLLDHWPTKE